MFLYDIECRYKARLIGKIEAIQLIRKYLAETEENTTDSFLLEAKHMVDEWDGGDTARLKNAITVLVNGMSTDDVRKLARHLNIIV